MRSLLLLPDSKDLPSSIPWLDPDRVARELMASDRGIEPWAANARAILLTEDRVDQLIEDRQPFVVETVLSTDKYHARVKKAQALGFRAGMIYIALSSVDLAVLRVRDRVASGGHDVPEAKIRARWGRSLDDLTLFAGVVDRLLVFCNDRPLGPPQLIAVKDERGVSIVNDLALPEVTIRLRPAQGGAQ